MESQDNATERVLVTISYEISYPKGSNEAREKALDTLRKERVPIQHSIYGYYGAVTVLFDKIESVKPVPAKKKSGPSRLTAKQKDVLACLAAGGSLPPTAIGLRMGYPKHRASGSVAGAIKSLVAKGLIGRTANSTYHLLNTEK